MQSGSGFCDEFFPIPEHLKANHDEKVSRGYATMLNLPVIICGLARNLGNRLKQTIDNIERLGRRFSSYNVFVYENDSADLTRLALEGWASRNPRVVVLGRDRGDPVNPQTRDLDRAARMAAYRNELRSEVIRCNAPYVIVVDMDLTGGFSIDGVANTFGHTGWDMVGSNGILFRSYGDEPGKPVYFDVWAFRLLGSDVPQSPTVINPMYWPRGSQCTQVNSCFGGLGVYRMEAFKRCTYSGGDCEHVPFHRSMREMGLGRIFMNPSQVTHYGGAPAGKLSLV